MLGLSIGVRKPQCETERSPPTSADVQNEWSYRPATTPLICLHRVDRDNFTFEFLCGWLILLLNNGKKKLRGLSPQANYTDRVAAAGRRS